MIPFPGHLLWNKLVPKIWSRLCLNGLLSIRFIWIIQMESLKYLDKNHITVVLKQYKLWPSIMILIRPFDYSSINFVIMYVYYLYTVVVFSIIYVCLVSVTLAETLHNLIMLDHRWKRRSNLYLHYNFDDFNLVLYLQFYIFEIWLFFFIGFH